MVLFLGPVVQMVLDRSVFGDEETLPFLQNFRNLVVGPVTEELVFRACMCPVLIVGGFSPVSAIIFVPFFFGIAHVHHIMQHLKKAGIALKRAIVGIVFQLGYTTIFGMYSAFIFVRTGHILPAILAHMFCNYMGFPDFGGALSHPQKPVLIVSYVVGLVGFVYLLMPLTDPVLYGSFYIYTQPIPKEHTS